MRLCPSCLLTIFIALLSYTIPALSLRQMYFSALEKSLFEANLQLYEAKCTLDEERAKIGDLERYKAMEKWMREHCYLKDKGLVTEHTVSLLSDFEKDFKKSKQIDREETSR